VTATQGASLDRSGDAVRQLVPIKHARLLAQLGISADAETVWGVLISNPNVEPAELHRCTGLSASRVTDAIAALVEAGLARGGQAPAGVVSLDQTLAIESHLARAERKAAEQAEDFATLRAALPQLSSDYSRGRASAGDQPGFEIVVHLKDIQRQIRLAAERVRHEIRSTDHTSPATAAEQREIQFAVLDRGVRDRAIVGSAVLSDPTTFADYRAMQDRGHDARMLPDISTRLRIYDRDLAVLPVDPANMSLGAMFIRARPLIDALILMYDHMWEVAIPIFGSASDEFAPAGRQMRVLELLSLGAKDEAIGRTLGIGVRSIRRDIAELKRVLGVSSRAEIVAAAIRKEWL
jgi:DNA-binding CsgD family transcriptional regulator